MKQIKATSTITITLTIDTPKEDYTDEQLEEWVAYHTKSWPFLALHNPLYKADFVPQTLTITKNTLL